MKKKIFAIAAICSVMTFAGCSNSSVEPTVTDAPEVSVSVDESASEEVKKLEEEVEKLEEELKQLEEAAAQDAAEDAVEETAAQAADNADTSTIYEGSTYTIYYDSSKWSNANDMLGAAAALAEQIDGDVSADDVEEMCDAMFYYTVDNGQSNFNVVTQDLGYDIDMDVEVFGPGMEMGFNQMEGYKCLGWEGKEINGNQALIVSVETEQYGLKMKMSQYMFIKDGKQTAFTLTSSPETFDAVMADFEAIINSAVLK